MTLPQPGDRVVHARRGTGRLVALVGGRRARVRFDDQPGLPRTVYYEELAGEGEEAPEPTASSIVRTPPPAPASERELPTLPVAPARAPVPQPSGRMLSPDLLEDAPAEPAETDPLRLASLRQAIEALRLGVVPADHTSEYTVARDTQLGQLRKMLYRGHGLGIVWGDYGTGKTHLLDVAEQVARSANQLVARITLDPSELPPSHPKRMYAALCERVTYPDGHTGGFEHVFQRLVDSPAHVRPDGEHASRFFSPFLHALRDGDAELLDWMRDYVDGCYMDTYDGNRMLLRSGWTGPKLLVLSDYRTYGRTYTHMIGTLACYARDAGYAGLTLLFDEVEYVDSLAVRERELGLEVLRHYAAVCLPEEGLGFDPKELYKGGHKVHQELPLRFHEDTPLSVVLAMTPLPEVKETFGAIVREGHEDIVLTPLKEAERSELLVRIVRLYQRAYPGFTPSPETLEKAETSVRRLYSEGDDSPRSVVRCTVLELDAGRLG